MSQLRWGKATVWAAVAFPVSYLIFNVLYIEWAVKTYPHNNSMAGFAAFIYGFPVGFSVSVVTFIAVLALTNRTRGPR